MKKYLYLIIITVGFVYNAFGQTVAWSLKLSSNVELRTLKLSNKVERNENGLGGANISLYQGEKLVKTIRSSGSGDFTIDVPGNGDFMLVVSFGDCNAKKFSVNTMGVPPDIGTENFKPSFGIGGFLMSRPLPGMEFLDNPSLK